MSQLLRMPPRRRREKVTDYRHRLKQVKSGKPRLVIRRTDRYLIVQLVDSSVAGDRCHLTVTSKKLMDYGWEAGLKNLPAAYLTGLLAGRMALKKGLKEAIVDIGLQRPVVGSRLFAVVKGAADAGLSIPFSEDVIPGDERVRGVHIREYFEMVEQRPGTPQFASSNPEGIKSIEEMFEKVKERIMEVM
jgi:large subunit ribosomal protein L18